MSWAGRGERPQVCPACKKKKETFWFPVTVIERPPVYAGWLCGTCMIRASGAIGAALAEAGV